MKHVGRVSVVMRVPAARNGENPVREPGFADAKTDLLNALWRDFQQFVYQKKTETSV